MSRFTNIAFSSVISVALIFLAVLLSNSDAKNTPVTKPKVDIAWMFDTHVPMGQLTAYKRLCNALEDWLKQYYIGSRAENTQFAIGYCYQRPPNPFNRWGTEMLLNLTGNISAEFIAKLIPRELHPELIGTTNPIDVGICFDKINKEFFNNSYPDRPDAPNVLLYISDCRINFFLHAKQFIDMVASIEKTGGFFNVLCLIRNDSGFHLHPKYSIIFKDSAQFVEEFNNRMLGITVKVVNCESEDVSIGCRCNDTQSGEAMDCPKELTINCLCSGFGNRSQSDWPQLEVSSKGSGSLDQTDKSPLTKVSPEGSERTKETKESPPKAQPVTSGNSDSTPMIIGFVVAGLVLLILVIIVMVVVVLRQKRQKSKQCKSEVKHGKVANVSEKERKEKMKGIQADISVPTDSESSKMVKQPKTGKSPKSSVSSPKPSKSAAKSKKFKR